MQINILDITKTGAFGELRIGDPEESVIACLGEPEARSRKSKPLEILQYGMVQLHLSGGRLAIMSVHFEQVRSWPTMQMDGWLPPVGTGRGAFVATLDQYGVRHRTLTLLDEVILATEGHAIVTFTDGELASVSVEVPGLRRFDGDPWPGGGLDG